MSSRDTCTEASYDSRSPVRLMSKSAAADVAERMYSLRIITRPIHWNTDDITDSDIVAGKCS